MSRLYILMMFVLSSIIVFAQADVSKEPNTLFAHDIVKPRMRIIIDNDFGGDPDGLFELVHHLLSPSVDVRAIIGSHLRAGDGFDRSNETAANAKKKIEELLNIMNLGKTFPVYQGSNMALENDSTAQRS